jgi:hypothetical protein
VGLHKDLNHSQTKVNGPAKRKTIMTAAQKAA